MGAIVGVLFIIFLIFFALIAIIISAFQEGREERKLEDRRKYGLKKPTSNYKAKSKKESVEGNKLSSISAPKTIDKTLLRRSYIRDIENVPILSNEQEIILFRQIQQYIQIERLQLEIFDLTDEKPSLEEISQRLGLTIAEVKKRLIAGKRAKEKIVAANLRLVVSVAKKYKKRNMGLLDLIQEGTVGLVRSVDKFDPERGYKFSTYANSWIRESIRRATAEKK